MTALSPWTGACTAVASANHATVMTCSTVCAPRTTTNLFVSSRRPYGRVAYLSLVPDRYLGRQTLGSVNEIFAVSPLLFSLPQCGDIRGFRGGVGDESLLKSCLRLLASHPPRVQEVPVPNRLPRRRAAGARVGACRFLSCRRKSH